MHLSDYQFDLPAELIAQYPADQRTASRLLYLNAAGEVADLGFPDCVTQMQSGDVLVLNDTKVIPARLFGQKSTGGQVEVLIERILNDTQLLAQVRASKAPKAGSKLFIQGDTDAYLTVTGRQDNFFELSVAGVSDIYNWLDRVGSLPLPPYIERSDEHEDISRYQTVFAKDKGAVAAPTAGLHFDEELLQTIKAKGVHVCTVTLHVGAGTYQPVRVENVLEHKMHRERLSVNQQTCDVINKARANGRQVIAVGTTVVRSLETAAQQSMTLDSDDLENANSQLQLKPFSGETEIFIYPGFTFQIIDKLITNFHLSESTLLMLVSAFSGREAIMKAYAHAIAEKYRFFSYGDAMLLERNRSSTE